MYSLTFFFFFKQKTAYEMRISDWSSDVCSSDLPRSDDARPGATSRLKTARKQHIVNQFGQLIRGAYHDGLQRLRRSADQLRPDPARSARVRDIQPSRHQAISVRRPVSRR